MLSANLRSLQSTGEGLVSILRLADAIIEFAALKFVASPSYFVPGERVPIVDHRLGILALPTNFLEHDSASVNHCGQRIVALHASEREFCAIAGGGGSPATVYLGDQAAILFFTSIQVAPWVGTK
jgi:hypothetical protein